MTISRRLLLTALIVAFGSAFPAAYYTTVYNVPQDILKQFINQSSNSKLSSIQVSSIWAAIASSNEGGKVLGVLLAPFLADRIGRIKTFVVVNIICAISVLFQYLASPTKIFVLLGIGRVINGFYTSSLSVLIPLFLIEIAVISKWRASVTRIRSVVNILGSILSFVLGLPQILGTRPLWEYLPLIPLPLVILETIWFCTVPETPMFQIQKGKSQDEVERSLRYYLGSSAEAVDTQKELNSQEDKPNSGWWKNIKQIFKDTNQRKSFYLWIILALAGTFSGDSVTLHYLTSMISRGGSEFTKFDKFASLAIYCVRVPVVLGALYTISRFGRKPLLLSSIWIVAVCNFTLAALAFGEQYFRASISESALTWVRLIFIFLLTSLSYVVVTLAVLIVSETAKQNTRAVSLGIYKLIYHISGVCITFAWPPIFELCEGGAYLGLAFPFVATCIYLTIRCPETKDVDFFKEGNK